jgi:hypothetical protein
MAELEEEANQIIRDAVAMKIHLFDTPTACTIHCFFHDFFPFSVFLTVFLSRDTYLYFTCMRILLFITADDEAFRASGFPDRSKNAAGADAEEKDQPAGGQIRVMEIEGLDFNKCCGTHLTNSSQLQLVKISRVEKSRTNMRMFFMTGNRALRCAIFFSFENTYKSFDFLIDFFVVYCLQCSGQKFDTAIKYDGLVEMWAGPVC